MKKLLTAVLVLAIVFVFSLPDARSQTKQGKSNYEDKIGVVQIKPGDPIRIGVWFVVAGPDASLGEDSKRGVELAVDDKKGKLLGHPIKLVIQDEGCNAEGGQAAATKLAADKTIVAAIGSNCGSAARAGVPILWKAGIPTISPSNTLPSVTDPNRGPAYDGYLRTAHNDKLQGAVAADFAYKELKLTRAATIHDGSPYAEQLQAVFAAQFKKLGGTITAQEAISPTDTDMRPVLTKIATSKPDFIYLPIFIAAGGHVVRQAKEVSGLEKTVLMGADGVFSPDFYKAAGEAAIGMYHSSPDFSAFAGGYKDFLAKHQKKYGEKPLAPFHAHAYDAAMIVFNSIEKVAKKGPDGTLYIGRMALRDAMLATKDYKGLTGNLTCDKYGDCADPKIGIYKTTAENVKSLVMPDKPIWKPQSRSGGYGVPDGSERRDAAMNSSGLLSSLKVTVLAEDSVQYESPLLGQHGISFLLEAKNQDRCQRVLVDVGQNPTALLHNMSLLGISPETVDALLLTHCHYDHTQGTVEVLKAIGKKSLAVVAHPDTFRPHYVKDPYLRHVGVMPEDSRPKIEEAGGLLFMTTDPFPFLPGLVTTGEVPRKTDFEEVGIALFTLVEGRMEQDGMKDDISLVAHVKDKGLVIVTGCSHAGIVNIVRHSVEMTGEKRIAAILGGFHLLAASEQRIGQTAEALARFSIELIAAGHCTGFKAQTVLYQTFGDRFKPLQTGMVFDIGTKRE